jgi:cellulose synthase/poly-beta-1,6-N-acetylglucosamine synthase-like glycosyltransferase
VSVLLRSDGVRSHPGMPFGFIRSASPESPPDSNVLLYVRARSSTSVAAQEQRTQVISRLTMAAPLLLAIGTAIAFYIMIGYPILLAYFFRRSAPPVQKDMGFRATVSVVLAVRNGEQFIRKKLECLLALEYPADLMEIFVISDGSTDATEAIVESFSHRGVRLLRAPCRGKSAALNLALPVASGEILFFTDVRQVLRPDSLSHLVANFADSTVGAVTGEPRFLHPDCTGEEADMELYWRYELWVRRRHAEIESACNTTGWIYALRRSLARPIPEDTLTDDLIIPLGALLRGYRVTVDPDAVAFDYPKIQGGEFRRKVRTLAGLWQAHFRLPQLFGPANRMRFHFLSHKSSRLVLPWAILLIWAATAALPASPFRSFLLVDELLLLALAAVDYIVPSGCWLKRISSPVRSFFIMNVASLLSVCVFVVPASALWRPTQVRTEETRL